MVKNILITGGAGYIGSHISEILIQKKKKIFILDNLSTGHKRLINKKAKFILGDISNRHIIKKILKSHKIDSVIHLAAVLSVGESQKKPNKYKRINIDGTKRLLLSINNSNVKNIIFSSTCAVYKDGLDRVSENSKLKPTSVYGKTKLIGEKLIKKFCKRNRINYGILRFFNVAGASPTGKIGQINKGDQLFKNLSLELNKRYPVFKVYGDDYNTKDGTCIRDYIHVSDIAKIHYEVLKKINKINNSVIFNCGYSKGISVKEVIEAFKKNTRKKIIVRILKRRKGDMAKITANSSKLRKFIRWKPKYDNLNKIVKSCLYWEKRY